MKTVLAGFLAFLEMLFDREYHIYFFRELSSLMAERRRILRLLNREGGDD